MQRIFIFLLLYIGVWNAIAAGPNDSIMRKNEISLWTGYLSLGSVDELYSFQKYTGGGFAIGASYKHQSGKVVHYVNTNFSSMKRGPHVPENAGYTYLFETRYNGITTTIFDLNYSFMRKLYDRKLVVFLTGNVFNSVNMTDYRTPEILYSSLGIGAAANYTHRKQCVGFTFSMPLASFILRNNYHISSAQTESLAGLDYVKENARVEAIGKLFIFYAGFTYAYAVSQKFNIEAQYQFRYISDKEPRELKSVSGLYFLGLTYKF
jgi:hypothetical protein